MIKYEIDENNFLTGNFAKYGTFEKYVELSNSLASVDKNLKWNGQEFIVSENPKEVQKQLQMFREQREKECFSVINRGEFWFKHLTYEQKFELEKWYQDWLNVTLTKVIPSKPTWLK